MMCTRLAPKHSPGKGGGTCTVEANIQSGCTSPWLVRSQCWCQGGAISLCQNWLRLLITNSLSFGGRQH